MKYMQPTGNRFSHEEALQVLRSCQILRESVERLEALAKSCLRQDLYLVRTEVRQKTE